MRPNRIALLVSASALGIGTLAACARSGPRPGVQARTAGAAIQLTSPAFAEGAEIPAKYTCDGQNISPPLKWSNVPKGARSIALICDDPDAPAGTWVHWVLYDLPPAITELLEGLPTTELIFNRRAKQGL